MLNALNICFQDRWEKWGGFFDFISSDAHKYDEIIVSVVNVLTRILALDPARTLEVLILT